MTRFSTLLAAVAATALTSSAPVLAQNDIEMVTAKNPAEMTVVMMNAGYEVELTVDGIGDPMIASQVAGMPLRIYFYGCDEETNDGCDTLQLSTGFDRQKPWTRGEALAISESLRFASVRLDDEGDPFISWDIVTGDGIPTAVFLQSLDHFTQTVELTAQMVFAEENGE